MEHRVWVDGEEVTSLVGVSVGHYGWCEQVGTGAQIVRRYGEVTIVPPNVHYNAVNGNFYHSKTYRPMGADFYKEWLPLWKHFPLGSDQPKQAACSVGGCPMPAVGKGRCREHAKAYEDKRRAYQMKQDARPPCEAEGCSRKAVTGDTLCFACRTEQDTAAVDLHKEAQLDAARTVEDLREWIKKYVL